MANNKKFECETAGRKGRRKIPLQSRQHVRQKKLAKRCPKRKNDGDNLQSRDELPERHS
jgi:hypothetical protein